MFDYYLYYDITLLKETYLLITKFNHDLLFHAKLCVFMVVGNVFSNSVLQTLVDGDSIREMRRLRNYIEP